MMLALRPSSRRAVAAVELAVVLPFLLIVILGVWEFGRLIQIQQIIQSANREGARVAAQGLIINKFSDPTEIHVYTGTPNVEETIRNYLRNAGLDTTGLKVTFQYLDGDTSKTEPYQASKNQRFRITTTLPFNNVRWTLLGLTSIKTLSASADWRSLVDDPFTLDTNIPNW